MDQSWEIIGIVIAILMVVIGLRLLLKKQQPLPPVSAENLSIEEISQKPVVPRQIRESVLSTDNAAPDVDNKVQHTATEATTAQNQSVAELDVAKPHVEPITAKNTAEDELDELQVALLAEPDLVAEAQALDQDAKKSELTDKTVASKKAADSQEDEQPQEKPDMQSLQLSDEDWVNESTVFDAHLSEQDRHDEESALATAQKIVALYVYPSPERALSGERTLKILLKYGLRFGELSCFHRYEQAEQVSPLMFSVLRVHEDGTPTGFDLETLPSEEVKGLAFFLALPNPNAVQGFDMMASLAGLIARDIDGLVFDEQSLELTQQIKDHWRHYVVEYDPNQPHE